MPEIIYTSGLRIVASMSSAIPIQNSPNQGVPLQIPAESFTHTQGLGGISWGGASVGTWLRDEVLMATKESARETPQPSSSSMFSLSSHPDSALIDHMPHNDDILPNLDQPPYFPSIEADFCKDYTCCGKLLPTLHDLLGHYEEQHISPSPPQEPPVLRRMQNIGTVSTVDVFLPFENKHEDDLHLQDTLNFRQREPQPFAPPSFQQVTQSIDPISSFSKRKPVNLNDDEEPTIDDPARQLYMVDRSENKPYKCPVIGCEKTYKNQNGLKYHRAHGHQNQQLHQNEDGTVSIIDPLSNTPYPDGMGMEKDKPYQCEICGKRYKNLNGLKYHRAHSTH